MHSKTLFTAAMAATAASAQTMMNLTGLLESNSNLSTLAAMVGSDAQFASMISNATNITLFAPSNNALAQLNQSGISNGVLAAAGGSNYINALLNYHVLSGMYYAANITSTPKFPHTHLNTTMYSNVTGGQVVECRLVNNMTAEIISGLKSIANVTQANLNFTGGVVHVIDSVLQVPLNVSTTAEYANLTALVGLLNATNLTNTVDMAQDITVFAPSNSAFQGIGSAAGNLTTSELMQIAEYHVINGSIAYSSLLSNTTIKSLSGGNLTITVANGEVFVNSARVVNADLLMSNGVMHVIDSVLNPNNTMAKANATESGAATAFSGASSGTVVPLTSGVPTPTVTVTDLITTATQVASGYSGGGGVLPGNTAAAGSSSSSKAMAAGAMQTGAMGAAALFGGAALVANF